MNRRKPASAVLKQEATRVSPSLPQPIFFTTLEQLHEHGRIVGEAVAPEIVAAVLASRLEPLLDRARAAEFLGCSLPTLDKLRVEGLPEVRVGDAPRFERDAVLAWLRNRSNRKDQT